MGCRSSTLGDDMDIRKAPPILYIYPGSAPCRATLFTVKGANITVDIRIVDITKEEQMKEWFLKINPTHTVPTMVDGDFTSWESRSIMTYLMENYAPDNMLYPTDIAYKTEVDKMLEYDLSYVYKHISSYIYPQVLKNEPANPTKELGVKRTLEELNTKLATQTYLAGSTMTIADFTVFSNVSLLELTQYDISKWPNLGEWKRRLQELPYYNQVQEGFEDWKKSIRIKSNSNTI